MIFYIYIYLYVELFWLWYELSYRYVRWINRENLVSGHSVLKFPLELEILGVEWYTEIPCFCNKATLSVFFYLHNRYFFEASHSAGAQSVTINATGCGFSSHSSKYRTYKVKSGGISHFILWTKTKISNKIAKSSKMSVINIPSKLRTERSGLGGWIVKGLRVNWWSWPKLQGNSLVISYIDVLGKRRFFAKVYF